MSCPRNLSVLLLFAAVASHALSLSDLADPRAEGRAAVDRTARIAADDLRQIDGIAAQVRAVTGGELVVVAVGSTGGEPARAFATRLFNAWRIGDRARNDGTLLFTALDDRKVEIVLGDGLTPAVYNPVSANILAAEVIPRLKRGDPGGALREGARACALRIYGVPAPAVAPSAAAVPPPGRPGPPPSPGLASLLGALLAAGGGAWLIFRSLSGLRRSRRCPTCGSATMPVGTAEHDPYLSPEEKAEEWAGSVDYQVRACPSCGFARKQKAVRHGSGYSDCPQCSARTLASSTSVLVEATSGQGGRARVDRKCGHCGFVRSDEEDTPVQQDGSLQDAAAVSLLASGSSASFPASSESSGGDGGSASGDGGASGSW
jgi:uncharacterized protein